MSQHKFVKRLAGIALVVATATTLTACSGSSTGGSGSGEEGAYTAAEVAAASGSYEVRPIFAVPKTLPEQYSFAFLNNGKSNPFFATWSQGMKDAAEFYGVTFDDIDLDFKYEDSVAAYQQLAVKSPTVIGANVVSDPLYDAITKDGAKLVIIDGSYKDVPNFGVPDVEVGQLAIQTLEPVATEKLASDWSGKTPFVVGLSYDGCPPCEARVKASFAEAESTLGVPESNQVLINLPAGDTTVVAQSTFNDFLTAHPDDVVLVVSYGDEPVIGAVNAAKAANRGSDVIAVTNGGDEAARAAVRDETNAGILIGSIDYQPYAEGWNWIEAAIAVSLGEPFEKFSVDRVLTADNVDTYYPDDKQ